MKWEGQEQSTNVEDRRGGGGLPIGGRGIGVGTIVIALVAGWIFGINPFTVLGLLGGEGGPAVVQQQPQGPAPAPPPSSRCPPPSSPAAPPSLQRGRRTRNRNPPRSIRSSSPPRARRSRSTS
jgi:hypothetical protein